jgi:hypothetical protein
MNGKKTMLAVGALAGLIVGGSGVAVAGVMASSDVITACVTASGTLRVPTTARPTSFPSPTSTAQTELAPTGEPGPEGCLAGEKVITWNQQGPTGRTGAAGATGPAGPAGPNPFDKRFDGGLGTSIFPHTEGSYVAECLPGQIAVSGGYKIYDFEGRTTVPDVIVSRASLVFIGEKSRSYEVKAKNPTDRRLSIWVDVLCVPE